MVLLGVGAVTLTRAQQTGDKAVTPIQAKSELRERVLTLRTGIDLLQLEVDADRETLLEWFKETGKADLLGIDYGAKLQTEMSELIEKEAGEKKAKARELLKKTVAEEKDKLNKTIEHMKKEFAKKARLLNEKKLELAETEAKYAAVKS